MSQSAPFSGKIFEPRNVASWILFTFGAGIVNAGAVLASDTVVSHITGNVTNVALDASLGAALAIAVGSFLAGAMMGSFFAERFAARPIQAFVAPVAAASGLLFVVSSLGAHGAFGTFGVVSKLGAPALIMLALLASSMGLLNSGVAAATGNQVRTTHLTGPITDLGGNLVRGMLDRGQGRTTELRWAALRGSMLVMFAVGAVVAARLAVFLDYRVFFVAAGILASAATLAAPSLIAKEEVGTAEEPAAAPVESPIIQQAIRYAGKRHVVLRSTARKVLKSRVSARDGN